MKKACLIAAVIVAVLLHSTASWADEIRVLSSVGIKAVVDELAPQFEKATKHKVTMVFGLAGALKAQIEKGEPFDVAILTPPLLDDLIAKGLVPAKSTIARTGLGLMIKAGARKPDISTVDAFKKTLLAAKSITFASAGASGVAFMATAKQLGIADAIKTKPAASGEEVNQNILSGASDLAVLPISEILPVKGAELGGVFPADVQTFVIMAAGINPKAKGTAAKDFVAFLMSPANNGVIKTKGMERLAAARSALSRGDGVGGVPRISGRLKADEAIDVPEPVIVELEFARQHLTPHPFDGSRRGIERVNRAAELGNHLKIKGDILSYAEGIDDRACAERLGPDGPTAVFRAEPFRGKLNLAAAPKIPATQHATEVSKASQRMFHG
jgi:molybdate transport system substrate-binding protein